MFIVIEGLDGAGKSTQVARLQQFIESTGRKWEYLHFPRFDSPFYGELIARFLRGDLGEIDKVDPYLVAMLYAGDRADAAGMIRQWKSEGKVVIVDRYVLSNIAYQCAKCTTGTDRLAQWINELEYNHNGIPKPDLEIFLDVPFEFTQRKLTEEREGDDRGYLEGKKDIHEASLPFQQRVRNVYLNHSDKNYKIISCADTAGGRMLPIEQISEKIISEIKPLL